MTAVQTLEALREARDKARDLADLAPEMYSALLALEQAYTNKHSPWQRAACLNVARAVLAKVSP